MHIILIVIVLLGLLFGPQWWASYTFRRYAKPRQDIPGTGGELARHLLDSFDMHDVGVERGEPNQDHYDPTSRTVRLSPDNFDINSLTAITVACHEVGHAIQHQRGSTMLAARTRLVKVAAVAQQLGAGVFILLPVVTLLTRAPAAGLIMFIAGIASMGGAALVHLVTLPVEIDASFNKALPILLKGNYVSSADEPAVKRILRAAAFTYVAVSLASLLNVWRWIALLRR